MLLGIDYGTKRIGLALGDMETGVVTPWRVIQTMPQKEFLAQLRQAIDEYHVTRIIVGEPRFSTSEPTAQTEITMKFVAFLRTHINLPIETEDEFFTTKEARHVLRSAGLIKDQVDAHAAALILQAWIDKNKQSVFN
ncbi:MAG: Holliday junction resolvase RuvX [Patescibacteria group bacterium]|nr:Holliday junction resolvase RuvX [Patescibacteria group bacterium]MDE2437829.1 Holliday junction resolvase RuvX [Patescibacteria group bacterium]